MASVVSYSKLKKENKIETTVGLTAKNKSSKFPSTTVYEVKRIMGLKFDDARAQHYIARWPFTVKRGVEDEPLICLDFGDSDLNQQLLP